MGKSVARITKSVPPLRDGDRMKVPEFMRRYEADPTVARAELINGVVYINAWRHVVDGVEYAMSPISEDGHGREEYLLTLVFGNYELATPGVAGSSPTTVQVPRDDFRPEPDVLLRILPEYGGGTSHDAKGYLVGAPELVVEVSKTSADRDLGPKMNAYRRAGIQEYVVWRTQDGAVDWFTLRRRRYVALPPHADGSLRSAAFPGLWLDVSALLAGDLAKVMALLQQGTTSAEHAAFVAKLRKAAARK